MVDTSWHKQAADKPLFENLLWSRPQNKRSSGKLLIVGGNAHGFSAPVRAYSESMKAGIGSARVMLPDALAKTVGSHFAEAEFAPSTPVGSFGRQALDSFLAAGLWADGLLATGDFGRNSETAVLLENFAGKHSGFITFTDDSVDYFYKNSEALANRPNTALVLDFSQLQKLATGKILIKHSMDLNQFCVALSELSQKNAAAFISFHAGQIVVAVDGRVSTTPAKSVDFLSLSVYSAVWQLQQPANIFETLTTAIWCYLNS